MAFGVTALSLGAAVSLPPLATPAFGASTLVIGVDHADPANQQPQNDRVLEYTDFFSRSVTVNTGQVLDFRTAPGTAHAVGLAPSQAVARQVYPLVGLDRDDPNAIGSG